MTPPPPSVALDTSATEQETFNPTIDQISDKSSSNPMTNMSRGNVSSKWSKH